MRRLQGASHPTGFQDVIGFSDIGWHSIEIQLRPPKYEYNPAAAISTATATTAMVPVDNPSNAADTNSGTITDPNPIPSVPSMDTDPPFTA